jgi:hypothetical protein
MVRKTASILRSHAMTTKMRAITCIIPLKIWKQEGLTTEHNPTILIARPNSVQCKRTWEEIIVELIKITIVAKREALNV